MEHITVKIVDNNNILSFNAGILKYYKKSLCNKAVSS